MSVFNSISVAVLIVLLVAGAITGLSAAGTDFLNPNTSDAEADRIRAETAHLATMNELQEQSEKAKTEAEIASIQRQQELEQQRFKAEITYIEQLNAKKLAAYEGWVKVRDIILLTFGFALSGGLLLLAGGKVLTMYRSIPVQRQPLPRKVIAKQDWQRQIEMARANERLFRTTTMLEARLKAKTNPASPDKNERDNLPLAI